MKRTRIVNALTVWTIVSASAYNLPAFAAEPGTEVKGNIGKVVGQCEDLIYKLDTFGLDYSMLFASQMLTPDKVHGLVKEEVKEIENQYPELYSYTGRAGSVKNAGPTLKTCMDKLDKQITAEKSKPSPESQNLMDNAFRQCNRSISAQESKWEDHVTPAQAYLDIKKKALAADSKISSFEGKTKSGKFAVKEKMATCDQIANKIMKQEADLNRPSYVRLSTKPMSSLDDGQEKLTINAGDPLYALFELKAGQDAADLRLEIERTLNSVEGYGTVKNNGVSVHLKNGGKMSGGMKFYPSETGYKKGDNWVQVQLIPQSAESSKHFFADELTRALRSLKPGTHQLEVSSWNTGSAVLTIDTSKGRDKLVSIDNGVWANRAKKSIWPEEKNTDPDLAPYMMSAMKAKLKKTEVSAVFIKDPAWTIVQNALGITTHRDLSGYVITRDAEKNRCQLHVGWWSQPYVGTDFTKEMQAHVASNRPVLPVFCDPSGTYESDSQSVAQQISPAGGAEDGGSSTNNTTGSIETKDINTNNNNGTGNNSGVRDISTTTFAGNSGSSNGLMSLFSILLWIGLVAVNLIAGLLAAGELIQPKVPALSGILKVLKTKSQLIGLISLCIGGAGLVWATLSLSFFSGIIPQATAIALGFILSIDLLINKKVSQNESAAMTPVSGAITSSQDFTQDKMQETVQKTSAVAQAATTKAQELLANNREKFRMLDVFKTQIGLGAMTSGVLYLFIGGGLWII